MTTTRVIDYAAYTHVDQLDVCVENCGHDFEDHLNLLGHMQIIAWWQRHGLDYGYATGVADAVSADWADAITEDTERTGPLCTECRTPIESGHTLCVPCGWDALEEVA
jgi:hypothetical protein